MFSNAALFLFSAVQHAAVAIGPYHEPRITPATVVEIRFGLSLAWGASAVYGHSVVHWRVALISNFVALVGVLLGMATLALGAGPSTASNDFYHRIMRILIGASLIILFSARSRLNWS